MTGYTIKKILPDEIILSQTKISLALLMVTAIGIIFLILSLLTKLKIINPPAPTFNVFLGMGIIFTAGGILFMLQKIPDTITFSKNKTAVIFSENNQIYSKSFADFSKLLITGKLSHSENGTSNTFQLDLISNNGSSLLLCESDKKTDLQKIAESLLLFIDIDFLSGADILHKGEKSYAKREPVYPDKNVLSIKSDNQGDSTIYTWHCRKSLFSIFLLGAVIFGFNYLFITWAFPSMSGFNIGLYVGGFILVIMDLLFTWTFIFYLFGSNIAEVSNSSFLYKQKLFGYSLNSRTFNTSNIAMISSGFTSEENKITIFTSRGMDIYNGLKIFAATNKLNDKSALMEIFPKVMELRNNIIEIDGTTLYYYEKLYLENEWYEKLNIHKSQGSL